MKFTVEIDGRQEVVEVVCRPAAATAEGAQEMLQLVRGGKTVEVRVVYRDGPQFVLEIEERQGEHVQRRRLRAAGYADGEKRQLWVNGSTVHYRVLPEHGAGSETPVGSATNENSLSASIPAVVSEVLVGVGEQVSAGQKLILLESMKMILPIQAPRDGVVTAIHCEVGEAVQPGRGLVEIGEKGIGEKEIGD